MDSAHGSVEIWWPKVPDAFVFRQRDLIRERHGIVSDHIGANLELPDEPPGEPEFVSPDDFDLAEVSTKRSRPHARRPKSCPASCSMPSIWCTSSSERAPSCRRTFMTGCAAAKLMLWPASAPLQRSPRGLLRHRGVGALRTPLGATGKGAGHPGHRLKPPANDRLLPQYRKRFMTASPG